MKINNTFIDSLFEIEIDSYNDSRGYFYEAFNAKLFHEKTGINITFVQDNVSLSRKNVLRGLHYQLENSQAKIVHVVKGKILDVAVDLRKGSKTFGKYYSVILSSENKKQLFVPKNFAHGFLTLDDETYVSYKTSDFYDKKSEKTLIWNDTNINIDWGLTELPIISDKDKEGKSIEIIELP